MVTFIICLVVLIGGYLIYSRVSQKIFAPDNRNTPAIANPDNVDITPIKKWKAFLIELLNIAGTGPIFGAISGALFGPIVFVWIVIGCILGGGVHDYFCGMISSRNNGHSIVLLAGKYIGKAMKIILSIFSLLLLILVTTVFVVSPSSLLQDLTQGYVPAFVFMIIILAYYLIATLLPIDKIIGKAYPVFGIILVLMAVAVIFGIFIQQGKYPMIELIDNFKDFSAEHGGLPWWPFMLTTVACGAVSGFHATQTPMIAKCITNEKDGRQVFYGAMVAEGVIALIWAAAAIAFYKTNTQEGYNALMAAGGGSSKAVYDISSAVLGPIGSILAVIGVIICPITSGDTALRGARLIIGELFNIDQKKIKNRLFVTLPLFIVIVGISLWNFLDPQNFNMLWRWFAWSNQTLACVALIVCTFYLLKHGKYRFGYLVTGIPAIIMFGVVSCYLFTEPNIALGRFIPNSIGLIISGCLTLGMLVFFIIYICNYKRKRYKL